MTLQFSIQQQGHTAIIPATYDNAIKFQEFEATLPQDRILVKDFATKLGEFYLAKWNAAHMLSGGDPTGFIVGGYDDNEPYGRLYLVTIPTQPAPSELLANTFGLQMAGQNSVANGLLAQAPIPWQLLPLQDCIDVAILAVKTTAELQKFVTDIRGVGGPVDVAIITKIDGFRYIQSKSLRGEHGNASSSS